MAMARRSRKSRWSAPGHRYEWRSHVAAGRSAELLAGNPDVQGLLLGFADWHCELRILQNEERRRAGTQRRE
jgi:hypothetical protein